ncbi:MAG: nucleotide sugar dehydrogenase [Mangrovicoccus sp.]
MIERKEAHVVTVGQGYVGLPLALSVYDAGFRVTGLDLNAARVEAINSGQQVLSYFPKNRVGDAVRSGRFGATSDFSIVADADIIVICVPTPLSAEGEPDLSYVQKAGEGLSAHLKPGQLVALESTVWPGATHRILRPELEKSELTVGAELFLGFSPEREDPGNAVHHTHNIPKVVGADDQFSRNLMQVFYETFIETAVPVSSCAVAEAVKLVENSFRTLNIAYVNELKTALSAMGIDIWEVIPAAATKPFGYMPFYPGPGIGGDCIPVSPVYLSWGARDAGSSLPLVDLARQSSSQTPLIVAARVLEEIETRQGKAPSASKILLLGVSYKRDVEDTRVSPAFTILHHLENQGAKVDFHDPFFPEMPMTRDNPELAGRLSVDLTAASLEEYDAVLVTTDHTDVDYNLVAQEAKLVCDTRNVFDGKNIEIDREKLVKL